MAIVQTNTLSKSYGDLVALQNCSMRVGAGEVFGLLGPNGAGKTTLIRLLLGFLKPTSGSANVDGFDCLHQSVQVRRRLSYLPAEPGLFRRMRAKELLRFFASVRGVEGTFQRSLRLASRLNLQTDRRVALMSTGMRQKLALVTALAQDAPLLILDEPTANLDPNVRREVIAILRELRDDGRTILLSSHVLAEVEEICDRVAILREGQLVHLQDMKRLKLQHRISAHDDDRTLAVPTELAQRVNWSRSDGWLHIDTEGDLADVLPWITTLGLQSITIQPSGLRAVYEHHQVPEGTS